MSEFRPPQIPIVESVLHPTDFSEASERAFAHALAVALIRQTRFSLLHVTPGSIEQSWTEFPAVRQTLERWGLLERGSPRSAVFDRLGVRVEKIAARSRNPADAILDQVEKEPVELIVLATEGREGLPRWLRGSVAESVARESKTMTLFVPRDARGFVDVDDGHLSLRHILIPIDREPPPDAALVVGTRIAKAIGEGAVEITLLHVGEGEAPPLPELPEDPAWSFRRNTRMGEPIEGILAEAEERDADLIIMVTEGRNGVLDALRGSTTEQVLRRAGCPLLAVPLAWVESSGRATLWRDA